MPIPVLYGTRKYPLRGYILGSGALGTPGVIPYPLLVTSCDSPAGIGASLRTHALTNRRMDRQT